MNIISNGKVAATRHLFTYRRDEQLPVVVTFRRRFNSDFAEIRTESKRNDANAVKRPRCRRGASAVASAAGVRLASSDALSARSADSRSPFYSAVLAPPRRMRANGSPGAATQCPRCNDDTTPRLCSSTLLISSKVSSSFFAGFGDNDESSNNAQEPTKDCSCLNMLQCGRQSNRRLGKQTSVKPAVVTAAAAARTTTIASASIR